MEQLYHSPLEAYSCEIYTRWVQEKHYAAVLARLYDSETMRAEVDGKLAVCQQVNAKMARELTALQTPKSELVIQPGKCTCTVKTQTMRCDFCGKEC